MPFLSLDLERDGAPSVFHTMGGVNEVHASLLVEAGLPAQALRLNTEVRPHAAAAAASRLPLPPSGPALGPCVPPLARV